MVEVDVDMEYLAINDELDCVVLHDENGVMDDILFVPSWMIDDVDDEEQCVPNWMIDGVDDEEQWC